MVKKMKSKAMKTPTAKAMKKRTVDGVFPTNVGEVRTVVEESVSVSPGGVPRVWVTVVVVLVGRLVT